MDTSEKYSRIDDDMLKYIAGDLTPREIDRLWEKMIRNPEQLEFLKTTACVHRIVMEEKNAANNVTYMNFWRVAAAAVIAITISLVAILWYQQSAEPQYPLAAAELELSVLRSGILPETVPAETYHEAISLAASGETEAARQKLSALQQQELEADFDLKINSALGIMAYNSGNFGDAESYFITNIQDLKPEGRLLEENLWYLSQTYLNLQDYESARMYLKRVIEQDGAYYRVASHQLDEFPK